MSDYKNRNVSAHCETGVTNILFEEKGLKVSEPMALGIGSGLFFFYLPFLKVMGNPLVSYRSFPGTIFKKCCQRLGVTYIVERFRSKEKGAKRLDNLIQKKILVGAQTNIYWLSYIPKKFRFHFNAHNILILDKKGSDYIVSDPLLEEAAICPPRSLEKARFSKGPLAPKGMLYYLKNHSKDFDYEQVVRKGIRETVNRMLVPMPFIGIRAMKSLSKSIRKWPKALSQRRARLYLASVVRMQEEIGTGGAGFRYMYAGFLNESGTKLNNKALIEASKQMEAVADEWRNFATLAVGVCKERSKANYDDVADHLLATAAREEAVYKYLKENFL